MNHPNICAAIALSLLVAAESQANDTETRCFVTAPGECLQVTISGKGQDVVLIPGLFGSAFAFRNVIPLFTAAGYRTIVVEPLGVGSSARPPKADYSLTAQADRIQREPGLLAPRLAEVRCPVRLVLGAAPHKGGPSDAEVRLLQTSLTSFSISRVPGSGHFLFEEAPVAVVDAVDEMARVPRGIRRVEN